MKKPVSNTVFFCSVAYGYVWAIEVARPKEKGRRLLLDRHQTPDRPLSFCTRQEARDYCRFYCLSKARPLRMRFDVVWQPSDPVKRKKT